MRKGKIKEKEGIRKIFVGIMVQIEDSVNLHGSSLHAVVFPAENPQNPIYTYVSPYSTQNKDSRLWKPKGFPQSGILISNKPKPGSN